MLAAPLQPVYIRICAKKSRFNVKFPCHDRGSLILGLPYTGNVLNRPFNCILKAIKNPISSYRKGERIQLSEQSYYGEIITSLLSLHPFVL
jgi:hypothetical protein